MIMTMREGRFFDMNREVSRKGRIGKIKRIRKVPRIGKLISVELLAKLKGGKCGCEGKGEAYI